LIVLEFLEFQGIDNYLEMDFPGFRMDFNLFFESFFGLSVMTNTNSEQYEMEHKIIKINYQLTPE